MRNQTWAPSTDCATWRERMGLVQRTRSFFMSRSILEVETPTLSRAMGTDPYLDYLETRSFIDGTARDNGVALHLCTSPEFHMKRLLAAGWGDIWQLCKAFRGGESGPRHNVEFGILEWYRVGFDWLQLMDEVATFCADLSAGHGTPGAILARKPARRITWREAFQRHCGFDPLHVTTETLFTCAQLFGLTPTPNTSHADILDALMVLAIEPKLGKDGPEFLVSYPPAQAALAQLETDAAGLQWARRFELYLDGVELCNGYQELSDPEEQARRFQHDLQTRRMLGKRLPPIDDEFLVALRAGMPACSGVALGFDRLAMLLLGKNELSEVIAFPVKQA